MFLGQLWALDKKGILENRYQKSWKYCKESPWILPEEGKEGFVKIGHEADKHSYHGHLGQKVDSGKVDLMPKHIYGYTWIWERSNADEIGCFMLKNKNSGEFLTAYDMRSVNTRGKYLWKKTIVKFPVLRTAYFFQKMKVITQTLLVILGRT